MNIILTGASGTAGSQVLRQLLPNPAVGHITVLSRTPQLPAYITSTLPDHDAAKLSVLEHRDFSAYPSELLSRAGIKDAGAVIWALGVSASDVNADRYIEITHDYTMEAAEAFETLDKPPRFLFLSGLGATHDEQSRQHFARIKGRTEKHLTELLGDRAYHFRPPFISPVVPRPSERAKLSERVMDAVAPFAGRLFPQYITRTDTLAAAMINVALNGSPGKKRVFGNAEIERLATSVGSF